MKKVSILVVVLVVLAAGGYFGYPQYQAVQAKRVAAAQKAAADARAKQQQAANDAARKDIDALLKPMKVSSLMPGQPGIAIIDKKEYAEGDTLPLPKGKSARVTSVQNDGVLLVCSGLTFRLDPPGAPDLAAMRKPR